MAPLAAAEASDEGGARPSLVLVVFVEAIVEGGDPLDPLSAIRPLDWRLRRMAEGRDREEEVGDEEEDEEPAPVVFIMVLCCWGDLAE